MESKKSTKIKIISLVASLVICFLLIGVSVYAALTQTVTINNNINITTGGQTEVAVKVSEYINTGKTAITQSPESITGWAEKVTKSATEQSATGSVTPIDFNYEAGKNYYAYKFEFTNSSTVQAYAHITASAVDNTQLTIYYGEELSASMSSLENNTALDADVSLAATDGTGEFYIIVAANEALENLTAVAQIPFNINITIDQNA